MGMSVVESGFGVGCFGLSLVGLGRGMVGRIAAEVGAKWPWVGSGGSDLAE